MNLPPINPPSSATGVSAGQDIPPSQQAQNDLNQIQNIDQKIEEALARGDSPAQIQALVNRLKPLMDDLEKLAPQLSPSEAKLIDNAEQQYQREEAITPSSIALFQGTCDTVSQLLYAPSGANINVQALLDKNQLTELANTLQLQMKQHQGSGNLDCEQILDAMNGPLSDLQQLAKSGMLTSDQVELVNDITEFYQDNFTKYETTTPISVGLFQNLLHSL